MALPPPPDQTLFQRRVSFSNHPYIPPTPSLSPHSASTSGTSTPTLPLNSHYYRPPRSSLTSPTRSILSSTTGSPTRTTRQTRIQSILANDPLLSRLTTATISRLSNDPDFAFSPAEREWSLRAAEGIVKVGEWLREVEAWNKEWRRNGKAPGVGYLPPNSDRPKKRRKVEEKGEMKSIKEETEEELGRSRPLRRLGTNGAYHLKLQKQGNGEAPILTQTDRQIHDDDDQSTDEEDEYCGSLRKATVEYCLARVESIKSEIEELDVEALKSRVLAYRTNPLTGITNPLTDSSAIITAITLQLLPPLHRLTKLLSIWAVRLAVLRIVPVFLQWLQIAGDALDAGYAAINHPSISLSRSSQDNISWRGLEEETFTLMQETITQKVATAGKLMDTMLDALEGREDVLPDVWITKLEDVEEHVGAWEMDGERVVLEGRLHLEELRQCESRREEQEREREMARLIMEQERFAEEAKGAESVVESVMGHAEETERGLREALEANEDVVEGIDLAGDDTEGSGDEDTVPEEMSELLMRLEEIEKEQLFSQAFDSETEEVEHEGGLFDPRRGMGERWSTYPDTLPGQHRVDPRHGLSLGSFTLDSGSTVFHTPMQTPFMSQGGVANDQNASTTTVFHTPMPTPGMQQQESLPLRPGSTTPTQSHTPTQPHTPTQSTPAQPHTPTQSHTPIPAPLITPPKMRRHSTTPFYTPMPTPLMPAFQQGPPLLRRQPSMPCMPVPKLPPTAQIFTAIARREPPSPETPKRVPEVEKDVKKTSPIVAVARYLFGVEETKKERAKREKKEKEEEARRKEEEEREMIAIVDAETERLAKLEEAEKERAAKVKVVREKLVEAEKLREKERAAREIEEKRKIAEAEKKRLAEERRKKAELEARIKADEEEKLRLEVERRNAELERIAALEEKRGAEAALKAEEEERQRVAERQRQEAARVKAEAEAQRKRLAEEEAERLALEAVRVKAEEEAEAQRKQLAEEEAERLAKEEAAALEAPRLAAEAERQRLAEEAERQGEVDKLAAIETARVKAEEEAERQRQAEIVRLAAIETAKLKAEAESLRLIKEEEERKRQVEAERIAAIEAAQAKVAAERRRIAMEELETKRQVEVQRVAAIAMARLAAEEGQRQQAEIERLAALEASRLQAEAEAEAERLRLINEEAERQVEIERLAAIEAARVKAEEETERQRQVEAEAEMEAERTRAIEEEAARIKTEAAERRRLAAIEAERQRSLEAARAAEVERQRLVQEAEKKRQADIQHLATLEAARIKAEAEAAEEAKREEEEVARQRDAELQRLAAIETARVEREEIECQRMAELEAERLRVIEEAEKQRHAALEAARLEAEEEAERLRVLEQERKVEAEHQQEQVRLAAEAKQKRLAESEMQRIAEAEAQKAEYKRFAALEGSAGELCAVEDEETRKPIAEQEAKWLEEDSETEMLHEVEDEQIRRRIAKQEARLEADAGAETRQEKYEDEVEHWRTAQIKMAALEADTELYGQQVIEGEERRQIAAYEAVCEAEQAEEKQIAGEVGRQGDWKSQDEQQWEDEQAERERVSADIAGFEAAIAEDGRQQVIQEGIQRQVTAEGEIEQQSFAETKEEAESGLTFEELDRRRRLAEDERQRLADLALVEREQKRVAAQDAERLRMERQLEEIRLEAERSREREEEKQRQAQFSNHRGSNSEGDSISGDDITEDYQDVSSPAQSLPHKEANEDSSSENIYAEIQKHQFVPPPYVSMTPIKSRSSALDKTKYTTPEVSKGASSVPSSTPWLPESPSLGMTPGASTLQDDSEASSDMDDFVAAENLAAHNSLQQALNDPVEYDLPRNMQSPDHDMSYGPFNGTPFTLVGASTPQNHSDTDDSRSTPKTTIWDHAAHYPVFDENDSQPDSFADGSFPSDLNIDESSYPQLSDEDYEQDSDPDMVPLETSTPKPKRRPNMLGGLDSITEVLTPLSPRDEFFRPSDDNAFGTPSKKSGDSGNLMLPGGFSSQDSPTSRRHSFNDRKATSINLNLGSLQNKLVMKRDATPEPEAFIKAQRSQKSIRKAPLDMTKPRSLSSTGNYISPGSTTKQAPKQASQKTILGPAIKAIRRLHKEIASDDKGSVTSEQRWPRSKENIPNLHSSPPTPNLGPVPQLNINKRNTRKPSNLNTQAMPDKSKRLYQQKGSHDEEGSVSSKGAPQTPRLEFPQASLDDKVNEILASLPSPVRLTASNLQKLSETSNKRQLPLRPFDLTSPTGIPAPMSVCSSSMMSDAPSSYTRGGRKHNPSTPGDIKLYHLHRNDGQAPIKLYVRLVGETGERVMVRVGGGWADLAEYLKEYAAHHPSKRRTVSGGGIEIQDLSGPHHHTLHPSRSISSLRSNSPAPGNSRSNSPSPGDRPRSVSAMGDRSRSTSALGNRPASSMGNRPGSSVGVRGRERSSSLVRNPPLTNPPTVIRGGHNGTGKERSNLTPFQPLAYQRPSGLSPPGPPLSGSRPSSRGQGATQPPSRGQGANRPPSRPGSSHSVVGGIRRSASRLSFTESAFDPSETGSSSGALPGPLGLAGPKGKKTVISPESQAWVEGMMGEVLKASKGRRLTGGSNNGDMVLGDESSAVPGEEVQSGTRRLFLKMG